MQEDLIKNYNVTKEEEQEYLAYHSYRVQWRLLIKE